MPVGVGIVISGCVCFGVDVTVRFGLRWYGVEALGGIGIVMPLELLRACVCFGELVTYLGQSAEEVGWTWLWCLCEV